MVGLPTSDWLTQIVKLDSNEDGYNDYGYNDHGYNEHMKNPNPVERGPPEVYFMLNNKQNMDNISRLLIVK